MRLGYFPLPLTEAKRLRAHLLFPAKPFAALDPCVGDGGVFEILIQQSSAFQYGVELDAYRTEQARACGIEVIQGDALEVQCRVDSLSFLYLNPPYDFEIGKTDNQRMELVFLRHTGRWLMPGGVLFFIVPQGQLPSCARTLAEHFDQIRVYRLSDPDSVKYKQIAILAVRRSRDRRLRDKELESRTRQVEAFAETELALLSDSPEYRYSIPQSEPAVFVYKGLPLDEIEDKLVESSAYRQARRILLRETETVSGRPLTPLHGGHVGLLCTAGMLNGVFGQGELRHVAHWQSRKYTQVWKEEDEGKDVRHIREYFSHECSILWANGTTQILTHELPPEDDDPDLDDTDLDDTDDESTRLEVSGSGNSNGTKHSKVVVMPCRDKK